MQWQTRLRKLLPRASPCLRSIRLIHDLPGGVDHELVFDLECLERAFSFTPRGRSAPPFRGPAEDDKNREIHALRIRRQVKCCSSSRRSIERSGAASQPSRRALSPYSARRSSSALHKFFLRVPPTLQLRPASPATSHISGKAAIQSCYTGFIDKGCAYKLTGSLAESDSDPFPQEQESLSACLFD
jgi:hypothetical protein